MSEPADMSQTVSATREVSAPAAVIFELIADPSQQPRWDGNDNLAEAPAGQRVHRVGDVFTMVLSKCSIRENHVAEFQEARRIAWRPADPGEPPAGATLALGAPSLRCDVTWISPGWSTTAAPAARP